MQVVQLPEHLDTALQSCPNAPLLQHSSWLRAVVPAGQARQLVWPQLHQSEFSGQASQVRPLELDVDGGQASHFAMPALAVILPAGQVVQVGEKGTEKLKITTLLDALNDLVRMPERKNDAAMRMPVSGVYPKP